MSMLPIVAKKYDDGRTKQSFKDSTDINKIIKKAQKAGGLAHALKYDKAVYGEFTNVDLLGAYAQCNRAIGIFADLPAEVRSEFDQDAFKFAGFASDPANIDRLVKLLPAIAEPGDYAFPKAGADQPPVPAIAEVPIEAPAAAEAAVPAPEVPGSSSST